MSVNKELNESFFKQNFSLSKTRWCRWCSGVTLPPLRMYNPRYWERTRGRGMADGLPPAEHNNIWVRYISDMGWDKSISFENALTIITKKMRACEARKMRCYGYSAILLIQLLNGARVSETVRGIKEWANTENTVIEVLVSKKRRKTSLER